MKSSCEICSRPCGYEQDESCKEYCDDFEWRGLKE